MASVAFTGVLIIALVSVAVPLLGALVPRLPLPGAVVEVVAGIVIGPAVLGWVHLDASVQVLSDLGLGMLLFLAGMEIDVERLRGPLGRLAGRAFAVSILLGLGCSLIISEVGLGTKPIFLTVVVVSTSAGLLLPLLKDAGQQHTTFGQLVLTAAALAEVASVLTLSLLFSATAHTAAARLASLATFVALLAVIALALAHLRRSPRVERLLERLEDRSGQLRVRAALTLALSFAVLANRFGLASILGAFAAGLLVRTIDLTGRAPHPHFQIKLEGVGFGFLVPIFFITVGIQFDATALVRNPTAMAAIPLFLAALLIVRAIPALLYTPHIGRRHATAAGLMQATNLTFVIVAAQLGVATGQLSPTAAASLLAAGLLSAALFPLAALKVLPTPAPPTPPAQIDRSHPTASRTLPEARPAAQPSNLAVRSLAEGSSACRR